MRYVGEASITQGVIWDSLTSHDMIKFGFAKRRLMILFLLFCLAVQLKA